MPTPLIAFSNKAPPRGYCSETTPSVVGQKKVLPNAYRVAARKSMITLGPALPSQTSPTAAIAEETASRPRGEMRWTIGPAKNLSTNMMAEV